MDPNGSNGPKGVQMGPNGSKWVQMGWNRSELVQIGLNRSNRSNLVQIGPRWSKIVNKKESKMVENFSHFFWNGPKWPKMAPKWYLIVKWFKIVLKGPKLSKMYQNVPKHFKIIQNFQNGWYIGKNSPQLQIWSKMVYYGLMWSNMVQFLSTKSSKWVRHNQVSLCLPSLKMFWHSFNL